MQSFIICGARDGMMASVHGKMMASVHGTMASARIQTRQRVACHHQVHLLRKQRVGIGEHHAAFGAWIGR
jgi:hypothetical protein